MAYFIIEIRDILYDYLNDHLIFSFGLHIFESKCVRLPFGRAPSPLTSS